MESLLYWLVQHAENAPYIIFGLLLLTGFSLPVSEDLLLIVSGVLAASVIPDSTIPLFIAVFLGCYFSDCVAYGIGRYMGPKALGLTWMSKRFTASRRIRIQAFFDKYGIVTLIVGRCIPFGIRNAIFMFAGAGNMHFGKFAISDGLACFFFSLFLFSLAYVGSQNYEVVYDWVHKGSISIFIIFLVCTITFASIFYYRRKKRTALASKSVQS
jgi:membrane-associated protein